MAFTYFFRDRQTLDTIIEHLVPSVMGRSKIKIWDAGCASGQEPYTMAILLAEKMGKYIFKNVEIHATDIDISNQFADIINKGVYPYQELQRIPEDLFTKYFVKYPNGTESFQVVDELRAKIKFRREDLLSYIPTGNAFSLILCKNVLLHQNYEQRIKIIEMFYNALADDGFLAMEQTQKLPLELQDKFVAVTTHAQVYKKLKSVCKAV
jgi:chemotaxis protein methyltransferase CheR